MPSLWLISAVTGDHVGEPAVDIALMDRDIPLAAEDHRWMTEQGYTLDDPSECMYVALEPHGTFPSREIALPASSYDRLARLVQELYAEGLPPSDY
jgi:hypothetical protein